ncbi:MAG TPA: hypothetical protein VMV72_01190 [Verrucomicrobiae bacterium]|nr:hypothetical protein [Verrucomicrobiae bacterium]
MTEKNFQVAVQYGSIVLTISVIFNIYMVMRYVEVYRDATRADVQLQQMVLREQAIQGLVQDFAVRANTDPQIAQIFRQAQAQAQAANAANATATAPRKAAQP